jgi:hypothetical protein
MKKSLRRLREYFAPACLFALAVFLLPRPLRALFENEAFQTGFDSNFVDFYIHS